MPIDLRVESLRFSGSEEAVRVGGSDLIVLIGPNNSGKSMALREIAGAVRQGNQGRVLSEVTLRREGTEAELLSWLQQTERTRDSGDGGQGVLGEGGGLVSLSETKQHWVHSEFLYNVTHLFLVLLNAEGRLQLTGRVGAISIRDGLPSTPLQWLLVNLDAERRLSDAVRRALTSQSLLRERAGQSCSYYWGKPMLRHESITRPMWMSCEHCRQSKSRGMECAPSSGSS